MCHTSKDAVEEFIWNEANKSGTTVNNLWAFPGTVQDFVKWSRDLVRIAIEDFIKRMPTK